MEARALCLWILPLLVVAMSASSRAQYPQFDVDGCTILASVVYTEVTRARFGYSAGAFDDLYYSGLTGTRLCNQTARSTTGAFTSALRQANIDVTWGVQTGYNADYCPSHWLSHCYPTGDPGMPHLSARDRSFVMRSWRAVYASISDQMSLHPGSNVCRFRADELGLTIRRSITASNDILMVPDKPQVPGEE